MLKRACTGPRIANTPRKSAPKPTLSRMRAPETNAEIAASYERPAQWLEERAGDIDRV